MTTKLSLTLWTSAWLITSCALGACGGDDDGTADSGNTGGAAAADSGQRDAPAETGAGATGGQGGARPDAPASDGSNDATAPDAPRVDAADAALDPRSDGQPDAGPDRNAGDDAAVDAADGGADPDAPNDAGTGDAGTGDAGAGDVSADAGPPTDGGRIDAADGGRPVDKDCQDCLLSVSDVDGGMNYANFCASLTGSAAGGPAAGIPKQQLCEETLDCYHQSNCHSNSVVDCYCGSITLGECQSAMMTDGACKTQLDRSLEVPPGSEGSVALYRITEASFGGGAAGVVATIEDGYCKSVCIPYTPSRPVW